MQKKVSFKKKLSVTLICILGSAGVVYFYESFAIFNTNKAEQFLWIFLFGMGFAYYLDYKLEITGKFSFGKKKNKEKS